MENKTQINLLAAQARSSESHFGAQKDVTVINTTVQTVLLQPGEILFDKYEVLCSLDVKAGEADLYVCRYHNTAYVAKVYRRVFAVKDDVVKRLMTIDSPYVARIFEKGIVNGFPAEILPYYKRGSLQGKKYSLEQLKCDIIPALNEGLHALHQIGIFHKDLKPSNIMLCDDDRSITIVDFGISSVKEDDATVIITRTGMTPDYSAPEIFKGLALEESDYYSMGITLFELFTGKTPYMGLSAEAREQLLSLQKIPFPEDMPAELRNLITGLTYEDIRNRKDKNNPNRRWTYDEVVRWCQGEEQPIPGEGSDGYARGIPPYVFGDGEYDAIPELADALGRNWAEGKKHLFRGLISKFYSNYNPKISLIAAEAEDEARKRGSRDDEIYWHFLYKLSPQTLTFYWKGHVFENMPALGRDMLEHLRRNDQSECIFYDSILVERLLSCYVEQHDEKNADLLAGVKALEDRHAQTCLSDKQKMLTYFQMAYMLSGQRVMKLDGDHEFYTIGELTEHMKALLALSYDQFEEFCHRLIDYEDQLDPQLEAWLIALGKHKELAQWRSSLMG